MVGNSYLEAKYTVAQLLEQNTLCHSSLEEQNTGTMLFRGNNTGKQTFRAKKILEHSYLDFKNTGTQLFR